MREFRTYLILACRSRPLADRSSFIVIYPSATRFGSCFDVHTPEALRRDGGSFPYRSSDIRHQGLRTRIDENVSPFQDSQFRVVPGLANSNGVSFESVNFPGRFLQHRNVEIGLDTTEGSALFRANAAWFRRAGFANSSWSSYESYNSPGRYIRHSGFLLILGTVSGSLQQADDAFGEP